MAFIKVKVNGPVVDGQLVKFKAPCSCAGIDGVAVCYLDSNYTEVRKEFAFVDANMNLLSGIGPLFQEGAIVSVILDSKKNYAHILNANTNSYIEKKLCTIVSYDAAELLSNVIPTNMNYLNAVYDNRSGLVVLRFEYTLLAEWVKAEVGMELIRIQNPDLCPEHGVAFAIASKAPGSIKGVLGEDGVIQLYNTQSVASGSVIYGTATYYVEAGKLD